MPKKLFTKGNTGKPQGAENKTTKAARELFVEIMEGQVDNIQNALEEIRKKDKYKYLEVLSKFFPYFIPKKVDLTIPSQTTIKVVRE